MWNLENNVRFFLRYAIYNEKLGFSKFRFKQNIDNRCRSFGMHGRVVNSYTIWHIGA